MHSVMNGAALHIVDLCPGAAVVIHPLLVPRLATCIYSIITMCLRMACRLYSDDDMMLQLQLMSVYVF